jgi:lipoprotein-anchoring transpeptidase ErfK/SrfK
MPAPARRALLWAGAALLVVAIGIAASRTERAAPRPKTVAAATPRPSPSLAANRSEPLALSDAPVPAVRLLAAPGRMTYGQSLWDDRGAAAGQVWVRIDREAQLISVFRGADEIGTAVILYGAPAKPTPAGRYPVLAKLRDHRSSTYDAAMPYTLRLTGDGVSIHAASVREGRATHGCIGVPEDFAKKLFDEVKVGDPVLIV